MYRQRVIWGGENLVTGLFKSREGQAAAALRRQQERSETSSKPIAVVIDGAATGQKIQGETYRSPVTAKNVFFQDCTFGRGNTFDNCLLMRCSGKESAYVNTFVLNSGSRRMMDGRYTDSPRFTV